jgi:hypothetical protein
MNNYYDKYIKYKSKYLELKIADDESVFNGREISFYKERKDGYTNY